MALRINIATIYEGEISKMSGWVLFKYIKTKISPCMIEKRHVQQIGGYNCFAESSNFIICFHSYNLCCRQKEIKIKS